MKQIHNTTTKILSVDFDNTICRTKYTFPRCGKPTFLNRVVWQYMRCKKKQGWTIILNTLREPYGYNDVGLLVENTQLTWKYVFDTYMFENGTPCGVKI